MREVVDFELVSFQQGEEQFNVYSSGTFYLLVLDEKGIQHGYTMLPGWLAIDVIYQCTSVLQIKSIEPSEEASCTTLLQVSFTKTGVPKYTQTSGLLNLTQPH